jgi:hypothetical protein
MDFQAVTTAIGSLGFPIVACCIMFYLNFKMQEKHEQEMAKVTEAISNNTIALTELTAKIGGIGNEN